MRHHHLQIRHQRHVGARPRDVFQGQRRGDDRLFPERPPDEQVSLGPEHHARAGEHLATFASHEARQHDVNAVLFRDVARQTFPPIHARRHGAAALLEPWPARRRRREQQDHLCAVQRRDRAGHGVPGVLADQHRNASVRRVERADVAAAFHKTLLVKHAVRRQEHLAMHMANHGLAAPDRHVKRAVVQLVLPHFVETEHDVQLTRRGDAGPVPIVEFVRERPGRDGHIADATFHKVSAQRRLREHEQVRPRRKPVDLREEGAEALEVVSVVTLFRGELGDGELDGHYL